MSAYGAIKRSTNDVALPSTAWIGTSNSNSNGLHVTLHQFDLNKARSAPGLIPYLYEEFADEIARGTTYPQQTIDGARYTLVEFEAYIFAADVLIAVESAAKNGKEDGEEVSISFEEAVNGRCCKDCVVGFYYIKPNYPGRSSHICNAGFVVPFAQRNRGVGRLLARSYLYYAPKLGYRASVFNLVYVNNVASVRLWDSLGFQRAGLIPEAGCETRIDKDGKETKEYVDAIVFYKSF